MRADNKLALNAGWDEELLALELKELMEADIEFDVGLTGFSIAEVDQLVEGLAHEDVGDPADGRLPDPGRVAARCRRGDIWHLGSHRLICGDALDPLVVAALMDGDKSEMVFTDPLYNVAIEGNVSGLGKIRHREFAMASGEMTRDQFAAFLSSSFANLVAHTPLLAPLIERETQDTLDLSNGLSIEILAANYRTVRGYSLMAALLDELAFFRSDDGAANPERASLCGLVRDLQDPRHCLTLHSQKIGLLWPSIRLS